MKTHGLFLGASFLMLLFSSCAENQLFEPSLAPKDNRPTQLPLRAGVNAIPIMFPPADGKLVWMMPPGRNMVTGVTNQAIRDLFANLAGWPETRARVDVFGYWATHLAKCSDSELSSWFGLLNQWGIKFALEDGAVKEWGRTGIQVFHSQTNHWDKLTRNGAQIYAVVLDEPFFNVIHHGYGSSNDAVQETVNYIKLVRAKYPGIKIIDTEPYSLEFGTGDHLAGLKWWITHLNDALVAAGQPKLDGFRVDPNWANFIVQHVGSWTELKELENFCRSQGVRFSLIYWPSNLASMVDKDKGWYDQILYEGSNYLAVGGNPDDFVLESWVGLPSVTVPEVDTVNQVYTFTYSVRDFCRAFLPNHIQYGRFDPLPFQRMYHNSASRYFYTADTKEWATKLSQGYAAQGTAGQIYWGDFSSLPGVIPLFRLKSSTQYFYTTSQNEYNTCLQNGWVSQGIAGYVYAANTKTTHLYRARHPSTGYFYTTSSSEYNARVSPWVKEGIPCDMIGP